MADGCSMTRAQWYFDFISPYAYLQAQRLPELRKCCELELRPVLLAALLSHWGQLGPAEIAPKRVFTYKQVRWLARRQGIALTIPEAHPFNPLKLLRLAIHLGGGDDVVRRLFEFVWRDGCIPENEAAWRSLTTELGVADADEAIARDEIKRALRTNTEAAIDAGVFGVPTLAIDGQLFWGNDATDMARDYVSDPRSFVADAALIARLPMSAQRRPPPVR
jgi:2-hydroxychromene-2-carboxylate isomerase